MITDKDYETKKFAAQLEQSLQLHEQALSDMYQAYSKAQGALLELKGRQISEQLADDRPDGIPPAGQPKRLPQAFVVLDRDPVRERLEQDVTFFLSECSRLEKKIQWLRSLAPK